MDETTENKDEIKNTGLADQIPNLPESVHEIVNRLGDKAKVLMSAQMIPPMEMIMLSQTIINHGMEENEGQLTEIEATLDIGLGVAVKRGFPFELCSECKNLPKCTEVMEGVEPIDDETAKALMLAATAEATGEPN